MNTLGDYYKKLLLWEDQPFVPLVHAWDPNDVDLITAEFQIAIERSQLKSRLVPIVRDSSNQSIGNQVESFFIRLVGQHLTSHILEKCPGNGYPDRVLREGANGRQFPFEIKATSDWNPSDSNRRVLTSSSDKLRRCFEPPFCHILATLCYEKKTEGIFVTDVRLDFLQPNTPVNIRLEASVNHKILSRGDHPSILI
jgi:hypothetical protein